MPMPPAPTAASATMTPKVASRRRRVSGWSCMVSPSEVVAWARRRKRASHDVDDGEGYATAEGLDLSCFSGAMRARCASDGAGRRTERHLLEPRREQVAHQERHDVRR